MYAILHGKIMLTGGPEFPLECWKSWWGKKKEGLEPLF